MKQKANREGDVKKVNNYDSCQTPTYALDPILPYLKPEWSLWESATGEGFLANHLSKGGCQVITTDLIFGQNFFGLEPIFSWHCQVTNPPYSVKYDWLKHSYELGKPFALLLPLETLGAKRGQELFKRYGLELILLNRRVDFKMPFKGFTGSAQFPVAWFTWGLGIGQPISYGEITKPKNLVNQIKMEL